MTAEQPSGQIWEPWQPQIGDHVRLRPSAECREEWGQGTHAYELGQTHGHFSADNGIQGEVVDIDAFDASWSHRFMVWTEPYDIGDGKVCFRVLSYSAGELELIERAAVSASPELARGERGEG